MLPGRSGRPRHASLCGTAWAEVPGLCMQRCVSASNGGTNPGLQIPPTILVYAGVHPFDRPRDASLHSTPLFSYICVCVFVHDWRCPLCHLQHPTLTTPTYLPLFPLVTRVGLTICVPVCSHSEERGSLRSWRR